MEYLLDSSQVDAMTIFNNFRNSSFFDRTKVRIYILLEIGYAILQPILICLKVEDQLAKPLWNVNYSAG